MLVARLETLAETILFRSPGDCSVLVQNLRLHLVGNGFIRSAFLETHYCTYGYVFCGSPVRNNGGNRGVSHSGRLFCISAKSASHHVGNRFACSVHYGFLRTIRLGYRNKCISISVKALLKSAPAQLFSAAFFAFCGCGGRGAG